MNISAFDLFTIGIGPSSSHTIGPMRAAKSFVDLLHEQTLLDVAVRIKVELFGSLGATGVGHCSDIAVLLGLQGESPETVDVDGVELYVNEIRSSKRIKLNRSHTIDFDEADDLVMHVHKTLELHSNGMSFVAYDADGAVLLDRTYYSIGGGFVLESNEMNNKAAAESDDIFPHPFNSADELLAITRDKQISISDVMFENEQVWRTEDQIKSGLLNIWSTMEACVQRGCEQKGELSGGLKVKRRAADLYERLKAKPEASLRDPLSVLDWVNLYALAVNEENAGGGRVVTAPTMVQPELFLRSCIIIIALLTALMMMVWFGFY